MPPDPESISCADFFITYIDVPGEPYLKLDDTPYHRINTEDVPLGYLAVNVQLNDNGQKFRTTTVAGQVGCISLLAGTRISRLMVRGI